jgi:acyl-CoA reductase-like NAD-dependent aldehyde dehydrogenase
MILDANQLASIRQHNDEELRRGSRATHGYPAHTVQDLLHTVEALKKEKKKWKKLAQDRGKALKTISELATDRID